MSGPGRPERPPLTRAQQILVAEHRYMVALIGKALIAARPFNILPYDELTALGHVALVEAAQAYDPTRGVAFEGFAWKRIHGAMMNGIRHEKAVVTAARKALYRCIGLQHDEGDIFTATEQDDLKQFESIREAIAASLFLGAAAFMIQGGTSEGETAVEMREEQARVIAALQSALATLSDLERKLIHLRYYEGRKLYDVAALLPLPESSTRGLHADIMKRLGRRLRAQGITTAPVFEECPPAS